MNLPIEHQLHNLADDLDWPEAPQVADNVVRALEAPAARSKDPWLRWLAVAAVLALATAALLTWAPARRAAADLLGVFGIRIEETGSINTTDFDLDLENPIALADGEELAGFEPHMPSLLDVPDGVYLEALPPGHVLSVWSASDTLPEVGDTGVGLLLSQFPSNDSTAGFVKGVGSDTSVTSVSVAGSPGFWIEGGPHEVSFVDADGSTLTDSTRLAGNVLIWAAGGRTYRLESSLTLDQSLAIAESLAGISR